MPPRLSTDQIQKIEQLADVCHIDRAVVLERYRTLFGQDYLKAWRAADFFEEAKAYEILALAIPTLGKAVKGEAINAVLKKRDFSSSTCQVLLAQLEQLIASQTQDDEVTSGYEVTERRIASELARWLGLPDPKIALVTIGQVRRTRRLSSAQKRRQRQRQTARHTRQPFTSEYSTADSGC
jgi:hypothetical protein